MPVCSAAASVNLDALCAVSPRDDMKVRFHSEGYDAIEMDLTDLSVIPEEKGTTRALIRGVAAGMKKAGYRIGGFDAAVTSTVAGGSGLSSSAALEVMLTGVLDSLYNAFEMPYGRIQIIRKWRRFPMISPRRVIHLLLWPQADHMQT